MKTYTRSFYLLVIALLLVLSALVATHPARAQAASTPTSTPSATLTTEPTVTVAQVEAPAPPVDVRLIVEIVFALIAVAVYVYTGLTNRTLGGAKLLSQIVELTEVIRVAVTEADKFTTKTDAEKYAYVSEYAYSFLHDRGIDIPAETVRQLIEGAVELVHRGRKNKIA